MKQALKRRQDAEDERRVLLRAHYAGSVPQDLLAEEMKRLTKAMAAADREIANAKTTTTEVEAVLEAALKVASRCETAYQSAPSHIRRQINQGFFEKLFIDEDGQVERAELTEPFAALLSVGSAAAWTTVADSNDQMWTVPEAGATPGTIDVPTSLPGAVWAASDHDTVDARDEPTPMGDPLGVGLKDRYLVEAVQALTHPCRSAKRLLKLAEAWPDELPDDLPPATPCKTARQLRPAEIDELVAAYRAGSTVYELAARFEVHRNTIGSHLRARGIDTTPPALPPEDIPVVVKLYQSGCSLAKIAARYNISPHGVSNHLVAAGVVLRGRHERVR